MPARSTCLLGNHDNHHPHYPHPHPRTSFQLNYSNPNGLQPRKVHHRVWTEARYCDERALFAYRSAYHFPTFSQCKTTPTTNPEKHRFGVRLRLLELTSASSSFSFLLLLYVPFLLVFSPLHLPLPPFPFLTALPPSSLDSESASIERRTFLATLHHNSLG